MFKTLIKEGVLVLKLESKENLDLILKYVELCDDVFNSNPENPSDEESELGIGYNKDKSNKEILQYRVGNTKSLKNQKKEFKEVFEKVYKIFDKESRNCLNKIFSKEEGLLKKIENSLDPLVDDILKDENYVSSSVLTVCKYFEDGRRVQCPSHTDQGILTFIIELDTVALQVYKPRKESNYSFINEEGSKNNQKNIIVLPGEQLSIISKRSISPTIHRVLKTGVRRTSIFFKLRSRAQYLGPMTEADYHLIKRQIGIPMKSEFTSKASLLPEELIFIISFYSTIKDVMKMRLVCTSWKEAIDSEKLWKFLAIAHFHVIGKDVENWKGIYVKKYERKKEISIKKSEADLFIESLCRLKKIEKFGFKNSNKKSLNLPKKLDPNVKLTENCCKLVIIGDGNIGKTSLLISYASQKFPEEYVPTVFDEYSCHVNFQGFQIQFALWDTAGDKDYDTIRPLAYPGTNIFLICYSVIDIDSFENIEKKWIQEVKNYSTKVPIILVGNKEDLRDEMDQQGKLVVSTKMGEEMAEHIGAKSFLECSAKDLYHVNDVFQDSILSFVMENSIHPIAPQENKNCIIN